METDIARSKKYAFVVLKPDALEQFLDINILYGIENDKIEGVKIVKEKMIKMNAEQAGIIYQEKNKENYYHLLEKFLTENPSVCLIVEAGENAIEKIQKFKDRTRSDFKSYKFEISEHDLELLKQGKHPQQKEITNEMALRNLIHVADTDEEVLRNIETIFTPNEIDEINRINPELYGLIREHREREKIFREIVPYKK